MHFGHIRLLERAKALGDYLIVGVTADDFDITRGKINVQQSLMERIEAVRSTGLADKIIVEEYEGQKIDDIQKYHADIFTVGSDWVGKFDYLNEYCKVVYLERTQGVSSSELRTNDCELSIGLVGDSLVVQKFACECSFVNGVRIAGVYTQNENIISGSLCDIESYSDFDSLMQQSDALYIASHPTKHYEQVHSALTAGKHVIYEAPLTIDLSQAEELFKIANEKELVLYAGIKTAYTTAYARMILLAKSGKIGEIVSVDASCTSLCDIDYSDKNQMSITWNSLCSWAPTGLLPVFQLLGTEYKGCQIFSRMADSVENFDEFSKISLVYPHAVASVKVGKGVKSEGELIISGTKGYIYVPAPWWKSDYFEIRYEDSNNNKRYFYQLDGEGIRYEIASFVKSIFSQRISYIRRSVSLAMVGVMQAFENGNRVEI